MDRGINLAIGKIDEFRPERIGNDTIESGLIDEAAIDHRLCDRFSVHVRFLQDVVGLRWLQDMLLNKEIGDLLVVHVLIDVAERN